MKADLNVNSSLHIGQARLTVRLLQQATFLSFDQIYVRLTALASIWSTVYYLIYIHTYIHTYIYIYIYIYLHFGWG